MSPLLVGHFKTIKIIKKKERKTTTNQWKRYHWRWLLRAYLPRTTFFGNCTQQIEFASLQVITCVSSCFDMSCFYLFCYWVSLDRPIVFKGYFSMQKCFLGCGGILISFFSLSAICLGLLSHFFDACFSVRFVLFLRSCQRWNILLSFPLPNWDCWSVAHVTYFSFGWQCS